MRQNRRTSYYRADNFAVLLRSCISSSWRVNFSRSTYGISFDRLLVLLLEFLDPLKGFERRELQNTSAWIFDCPHIQVRRRWLLYAQAHKHLEVFWDADPCGGVPFSDDGTFNKANPFWIGVSFAKIGQHLFIRDWQILLHHADAARTEKRRRQETLLGWWNWKQAENIML